MAKQKKNSERSDQVFSCRVDGDLKQRANAVRKAPWRAIIEQALRAVIAASQAERPGSMEDPCKQADQAQ